MNTLLSHLQEFGLSEKAAVLYQGLLTMGPASAREAAREAKLNRSSAYMLLATLVKQGFVEKTQQNGILKYYAVSPEKLVERADKLARGSARQENEMNLLLSELLSVSKKLKSQPHVLFYEGVGGIQTVSNDLLAYPQGTQVYTFLPVSAGLFLAHHFPFGRIKIYNVNINGDHFPSKKLSSAHH
jgi:Predicted transcriptional regulators